MNRVIRRDAYVQEIRRALSRMPIVSLLGPRQAGKTTLARSVARGRKATFFDLERP